MPASRFESVLDLIDENLLMNKGEVLAYIDKHPDEVLRQILKDGQAVIPTSAGKVVVKHSPVLA